MEVTAAQRIRAQTKEATRRALLAAGLAEAIEHPHARPSVEAICARAGYTRGAFYVYFKGRSDYVVEMLEWVVGDIFESIFRAASEGEQTLHGIVSRFTHILATREWPDVTDIRSAYLRVISGLRDSPRVRERHAQLMNAAMTRLEEAVTDAQRAGTVREDVDPKKAAQLLLISAIGMITWDDVGIPVDADSLSGTMLSLLEKPSGEAGRA